MPTNIRTRLTPFLLLAAFCLSAPAIAFAGGGAEPVSGQDDATGLAIDLISRRMTADFIGTPVVDNSGDEIGRVDELLLDLASGRITYFVLDLEETVSGEAARYPVPVYLIYPSTNDETVAFPIEQYDLLEFAPTMGDYPADARVPGWHVEVDTFWRRTDTTLNARAVRPGYRPIVPVRSTSYSRYTDMRGATVSSGPVYASTRLREAAVVSGEGDSLGTVSDYVAALSSARVPYAVVDLDASASRAVPLPMFTRGVDSEPFIFSGPPESLDNAPEFQGPDQLADEQWQERNLDYWSEIDVSSRYRYGVQLVPGLTLDSSEMVGYQLFNTNNQTIGRVEDLIITREGVLLYAEVSFGGFLGLGERRFAIPISALEVDPYHRAVVLDVSRDELDEIPSLDSVALPTTGSDWDDAIRTFWRGRLADVAGEDARTAFVQTLAARQDGGALRAQWLTGYPVTAGGSRVGSVSNLLIDVEAPAVSYIVVELPSSAPGEARWIPVPTDRITFDPQDGRARLDADRTALGDAPAYPFVDRPGVTLDRSWMNEVDEYWN